MNKIKTLLLTIGAFFVINGVLAQEKNENMFFSKTVSGEFDDVVVKVTDEFKKVGFGLITEIDMAQKLKEKLDKSIDPYMILGVCHPGFAYEAIQAEPNIGVFLPCKVIVKQLGDNRIEVVSSNPAMLMKMLNNESLDKLADEVAEKMELVIKSL